MIRTSPAVLPNLIIIGAAKADTTSLPFYFGLHPQTSMSHHKELNFFVREWNRGRSVEWYASHFEGHAEVRGESSALHTAYPLAVGIPDRMHATVHGAWLIYLVRDPIERMISHCSSVTSVGSGSWREPQAPPKCTPDSLD